ncbi:MAG: CBS domain-containing protein [Nanoarchaeota archaeon]|nr:CBS domain-containing protein [Nanoarchaeota archaeon]
MQIKELMKRPYVIDKDISLGDAARIMSSKSIGSLLFVLKGKLKGILTESDLLKNFGKNKTITQIMSRNILSISENDSIDDALKIMKENKIKRLPVIDSKKKLTGIISMTDIAANVDKLDGEFFF